MFEEDLADLTAEPGRQIEFEDILDLEPLCVNPEFAFGFKPMIERSEAKTRTTERSERDRLAEISEESQEASVGSASPSTYLGATRPQNESAGWLNNSYGFCRMALFRGYGRRVE